MRVCCVYLLTSLSMLCLCASESADEIEIADCQQAVGLLDSAVQLSLNIELYEHGFPTVTEMHAGRLGFLSFNPEIVDVSYSYYPYFSSLAVYHIPCNVLRAKTTGSSDIRQCIEDLRPEYDKSPVKEDCEFSEWLELFAASRLWADYCYFLHYQYLMGDLAGTPIEATLRSMDRFWGVSVYSSLEGSVSVRYECSGSILAMELIYNGHSARSWEMQIPNMMPEDDGVTGEIVIPAWDDHAE